jgi:hypothetical protein
MSSLGREVLGRALEKLGTPEQLARALHVPKAALTEYLEGHSPVPETILLRAVDLIADDSVRSAVASMRQRRVPPLTD